MRGATSKTNFLSTVVLSFQLTRPMRGATYPEFENSVDNDSDFNSHAPCGAQLYDRGGYIAYYSVISTHTPHAGRNLEYK